jgi:ubiquinone/menaquinone biosynthesis C-methylase UbiE
MALPPAFVVRLTTPPLKRRTPRAEVGGRIPGLRPRDLMRARRARPHALTTIGGGTRISATGASGEKIMTIRRTYLPAGGWDWFLPFYDPYVKLLGWDAVRSTLLDQMDLASGQRVLDIGCATGTLAVLLKQRHPDVAVVGLDPDPKALGRAARKALGAGVKVHFNRGFSDRLPYADGSFDRVSCTGMFSLLPAPERETTLREVRRVLRPGGSFHLLDGVKNPPGSSLLRWLLRVRLRQASQCCQVYTEEQTVMLMRIAGFADPKKTGQHAFWLWPLASYRASR